jgi:16S rRNA processing protein RimM
MNEIVLNKYTEVGYIQKPHGLKGEVILVFVPGYEETFGETKFVFIDIDGGLVPFLIEKDGFRYRNGESAICRFVFIDSLTKAKDLSGCKVFVPDNEIVCPENEETTSPLIGMRAFDAIFGEIGLVKRADDFSGNMVITVAYKNTEILIPLSDEVVTSVDEVKREIFLNCPNGLIELYL